MTTIENVWAIGFVGVVLAAAVLFRRFRKRTRGYVVGRTFKARIPQWVKTWEMLNLSTLLVVIILAGFKCYLTAQDIARPGRPTTGAAAVFSGLGIFLTGLPLAMLGANAISWLLPPLRRANLRAMDGLHVTFGSLNRELILAGCVTVPVGLLAITAAVFEPWAR